MKKIFFALVAVAAVAACAKTEPVYTEDNSEIKISPATALATKANVLQAVDGTEYPTKENFDVFAYWANEPAGSTFTSGTQYLINEGDNVNVSLHQNDVAQLALFGKIQAEQIFPFVKNGCFGGI